MTCERCQIVEEENEMLREQVEQLKALLRSQTILPLEWGLTASEQIVLGTLLQRRRASKDTLYQALYAHRALGDDDVEPKIVDVFVCKLRRKLKPFGIEIMTVWGHGYEISAETRRAILERCEGDI